MILLGKYTFEYSHITIAAGLDYLGVSGIVPEIPLTVFTLVTGYDLIFNNPVIMKYIKKISSFIVFGLLNNPMVRGLLKYNLNVDDTSITPNSVLLYKWASNNIIRISLFIIFIIFIVKVVISKSIAYATPLMEQS
jgi:hypothetical protein